MVDRCIVLEPYEVSHSAADMKQKLQQLLVKYNLTHCSATILEGNNDEDQDPNMFVDDGDDEYAAEEGTTSAITTIPLVFTTDNAPALVAAMQEPGWFRMCCFAHVTALAVNAANKIPAISKWRKAVTNIVGHFKHSA